MLKVTATIMRLGFFDRDLEHLKVEEKARVKAAIFETAEAVAAAARVLVPVSSAASRKSTFRPGPGELRDTIRVEGSNDPNALVAYVKAGTGTLKRRSRAKGTRRRATPTSQALGVYAMAVEFGAPHRGVNAEPYLRPALDKNRAAHTTRVKEALSRATKSVGGTP